MSDDYKSPFFDEDELKSFSDDGKSDELYSNSENQFDLNNFASKDDNKVKTVVIKSKKSRKKKNRRKTFCM